MAEVFVICYAAFLSPAPGNPLLYLSNKQPSSMLPELQYVALVLIHTIPAKPSVIELHLHPSHSRTIPAVSVFSPELGPAIYVFLRTREFLSRTASVRTRVINFIDGQDRRTRSLVFGGMRFV